MAERFSLTGLSDFQGLMPEPHGSVSRIRIGPGRTIEFLEVNVKALERKNKWIRKETVDFDQQPSSKTKPSESDHRCGRKVSKEVFHDVRFVLYALI